jgi:hypothetical protein
MEIGGRVGVAEWAQRIGFASINRLRQGEPHVGERQNKEVLAGPQAKQDAKRRGRNEG